MQSRNTLTKVTRLKSAHYAAMVIVVAILTLGTATVLQANMGQTAIATVTR